MEPKISSWSSGKIKTVDEDKKIGIIEDTDGATVIFTLDNLLLSESDKDVSKGVIVGKSVLFEKEHTKFGREAKNITLIDDSLTE